ncbi:MAG TPA: rod shape-determining protein MreD [Acetobacteraceae bacterium]|nr:rod shape-determining protein MreD [Acetobacteraceae bacterium]
MSRACFPAGLTTLLLLVLAAPLGLPGQPQLQTACVLASVYFWSLFRPAAMPAPMVFLLGLLSDLLGQAPPGIAVLTLLIVQGLALRWRRELARQGFVLVWMAFLAVAAGAALLEWGLTSVLSWRLFPIGPAIFEFLLAGGLYPGFATLLTRAHRSVAAPEQA